MNQGWTTSPEGDWRAGAQVLVIEDNVAHARFVRSVLEAMARPVRVHQAGRLATGCERLRTEQFDFVVTDLHLPDAQGASIVAQLVQAAPTVPVLVVSALDDPAMAAAALAAGAREYLAKDSLTPESLAQALRRAAQRGNRDRAEAGGVLLDPVSGVYNRAGLELAATKALAFARRRHHPVTVIHFDIPGGPSDVAAFIDVLVETTRDADLVGRLGTHQLAVVLLDDCTDPPLMLGRLQARLKATALAEASFSVEVRRFDPKDPSALEALLGLAPGAAARGAVGSSLRRVLVVADEAALIEQVRAVLGDGWTVLAASGAAPAARLAALEEPHLAIVDLQVAGGEGLMVVRRIAEQNEVTGLPIIGIVGADDETQQISSRARGLAAIVERRRLQADLGYEADRVVH